MFIEMLRYYWSLDNDIESEQNPMSTNISTTGAASPVIVAGVKRLAFQVESHLHHDISLPDICICHHNCSAGYTIGFWVKISPPGGGWTNNTYTLVTSGGEDPASVGFSIGMLHETPTQTTSTVEVRARNPLSDSWLSVSGVSLTSWTHIAMLVEDDLIGLFINGAVRGLSANSTLRSSNWTTNHYKLRLGQSVLNNGAHENGEVIFDEMHFIETVLTTSQLVRLKGNEINNCFPIYVN